VSAHLTVVQALAVGFTSGVVLTAAAAERIFTRLRDRGDRQTNVMRHQRAAIRDLRDELDDTLGELAAAIARHPSARGRLTSDERYAAAAESTPRRLYAVGGHTNRRVAR
jgi:hypothetical protein